MSMERNYFPKLRPPMGPLLLPPMTHEYGCKVNGSRRPRRETCPNPTLSTNPAWRDPGANSALRGGRSVNNGLSHSTALTALTPVELLWQPRLLCCSLLTLVGAYRLHAPWTFLTAVQEVSWWWWWATNIIVPYRSVNTLNMPEYNWSFGYLNTLYHCTYYVALDGRMTEW